MRKVGTVARGVRCPVIREGDELVRIVADSVLAASKDENAPLRDKDIVAVTEAVVARAQGNYATVAQIARDVQAKLGGETVGVLFPILSRNRFSVCLRGIAAGAKKVVVQLSYPADEVGNHLFDPALLETANVNPYQDTLDEAAYREAFGYALHPFTGVDYVQYYRSVIEEVGCEAQFVFSNNPRAILAHTGSVIACDIHTRARTVQVLRDAGARVAIGMDGLMNAPVEDSGYNERYGLLGSNKATETSVKLFPRDCQPFVDALAAELNGRSGANVQVMVYGDGAFKDPVGKIWELADPVVSPAYTTGLEGTPNEVKLKYLADNQFAHLSGEALDEAIRQHIREKDADLVGAMEAQGTTPRRLTDLVGSLCDLVSGSGDKGTPVVWVQGYFDNYAE